MILIYKTITPEAIRKEATETIPKLVKWFKDNPARNDCFMKVWYGQFLELKRGTRASIVKAVNTAAEAAINHTVWIGKHRKKS